ncbi:MAG: cob(I)yrinic acid a,c-diamide adenosyltransferase [Deltaproteobacteria bacterium]|nr:cob(I)yrinic acid a,c-diamide adenosyltransferase [Deltaproteobacteria bacterium]
MIGKIYTRTGDGGTTGLADGTRLPKHALRIEAYGTIDEANAHVGMAMSLLLEHLDDAVGAGGKGDLIAPLRKLQGVLVYLAHRLFNCSSSLARGCADVPEEIRILPVDIENLERAIDFFQAHTGPLSGFVLCGGVPIAAQLHIARTVMRRAERAICRLLESEPIDESVLRFVNRASDLLFSASRFSNFFLGQQDVFWEKRSHFPTL